MNRWSKAMQTDRKGYNPQQICIYILHIYYTILLSYRVHQKRKKMQLQNYRKFALLSLYHAATWGAAENYTIDARLHFLPYVKTRYLLKIICYTIGSARSVFPPLPSPSFPTLWKSPNIGRRFATPCQIWLQSVQWLAHAWRKTEKNHFNTGSFLPLKIIIHWPVANYAG